MSLFSALFIYFALFVLCWVLLWKTGLSKIHVVREFFGLDDLSSGGSKKKKANDEVAANAVKNE